MEDQMLDQLLVEYKKSKAKGKKLEAKIQAVGKKFEAKMKAATKSLKEELGNQKKNTAELSMKLAELFSTKETPEKNAQAETVERKSGIGEAILDICSVQAKSKEEIEGELSKRGMASSSLATTLYSLSTKGSKKGKLLKIADGPEKGKFKKA